MLPVVHVDTDRYAAGGASNVALNLAAPGARVDLSGVVGVDEASDRLQDILMRRAWALMAVGKEKVYLLF